MRHRLDTATDRLIATREYAKTYLEGVAPDEWFWQPGPGINNLVWHVGHLAVAEYSLCLMRIRGPHEDDVAFLPKAFFERYKRRSLPSADPEKNFSPEASLAVLDAVQDRVLSESSGWTDEQLEVACDPPHPLFTTRLGGFEWSHQHELTHVGQIALLRRLMGRPAAW